MHNIHIFSFNFSINLLSRLPIIKKKIFLHSYPISNRSLFRSSNDQSSFSKPALHFQVWRLLGRKNGVERSRESKVDFADAGLG